MKKRYLIMLCAACFIAGVIAGCKVFGVVKTIVVMRVDKDTVPADAITP